jgi:acetyl-CoA carboxylase biotin carboxyl carrier protein
MAVAPAAAGAVAPAASVAIPEAAASDDGLIAIESPMVGTYYAKPSPDKPSFLNVGDAIGEESVVCLIEAMKIFNEIKAEQTGTVAKILVQNGDAVEFGQPLILIKPE